ncbi:spondin domain-containing protein [Agaribacter flavus]|uniref:Spondin domain-containing protein n=1 Tax=Agaribacter flavus TaxID=1902781 RepID=A0ABV7FRN0_9ALTE
MKLRKFAAFAAVSFASVATAQAVEIELSITNLTQGNYFTPRLVVAHTDAADIYEVGEEASTPLTWLAEAGVIDDSDDANSIGQNFESALGPADSDNGSNTWHKFGGLVAPATTLTYTFDTMDKPLLSLATMLIPTNDAFVGMDSIEIPTAPGTYHYYLNAYDAGTELNDELNSLRTDISAEGGTPLGGFGAPGVAGAGAPPVMPSMSVGGSGVGAKVGIDAEGNALGVATEVIDGTDGPIHVHRNTLGDTSATEGASDLNSTIHRWLNPVAKVTIVVPAS